MKLKETTPALALTALSAILGAVASWSVSRGIAPLWVLTSAVIGTGLYWLVAISFANGAVLGYMVSPLIVLLSWYLQPTHPDWFPLWTVLPVLMWSLGFNVNFNKLVWQRIANTAPLVLIVLAWVFGGIPLWCLVTLLTLPSAQRKENAVESALVGTILFTIGYLITGIAR